MSNTNVAETVYRHVAPPVKGGASVVDGVFG